MLGKMEHVERAGHVEPSASLGRREYPLGSTSRLKRLGKAWSGGLVRGTAVSGPAPGRSYLLRGFMPSGYAEQIIPPVLVYFTYDFDADPSQENDPWKRGINPYGTDVP